MPYRPPRAGDIIHVRIGPSTTHTAHVTHADYDGRVTVIHAPSTGGLDDITIWITHVGLRPEEIAVSWLSEKFDEIKADVAQLLHHADPEVHAVATQVAAKVDQVKTAVETDGEALAKDAEADAKQVADEAVADLKPAGTAAEQDAAHLATQAVRDAESIADGAQ